MKLIEEVRGYLRTAIGRGVPIKAILLMMKIEKLEIETRPNTIGKFVRYDDRGYRDSDELVSFQAFFTCNLVGKSLITEATGDDMQPSRQRRHSSSTGLSAKTSRSRAMMARIEGHPGERPHSPTGLGSLTVSGERPGFGSISLVINVHCNIWEGMTLHRCQIDLDPRPGAMSEVSRTSWLEPKVVSSNLLGRRCEVELRCWNSARDPFWECDGNGKPIGHFAYAEFAALEGLSPGNRVTVRLCASPRDDLLDVDIQGRSQNVTSEVARKKRRRVTGMIKQLGLEVGPKGLMEIATDILFITEAGK